MDRSPHYNDNWVLSSRTSQKAWHGWLKEYLNGRESLWVQPSSEYRIVWGFALLCDLEGKLWSRIVYFSMTGTIKSRTWIMDWPYNSKFFMECGFIGGFEWKKGCLIKFFYQKLFDLYIIIKFIATFNVSVFWEYIS